jgi:dolichol kinase
MLHVVVHVDAIDFAILAIAGILFRNRDSEIHKRLMFLATIVVAARFPFLGSLFKTKWHHYIDQDAFFMIGVLYDLITRGRVNKAYIWGGLIFVLMPPAADYSFRILVPHLMAVQ